MVSSHHRLLSVACPGEEEDGKRCRLRLDSPGETLMPDKNTALLQGTLDMLILKTIALEPMHAHGIGLRIEQISQGVFQVNPGSLFPAFKRLERAGWVDSEWRATENNRRAKYYILTAVGRKQLKSETRDWKAQSVAITRILEA